MDTNVELAGTGYVWIGSVVHSVGANSVLDTCGAGITDVAEYVCVDYESGVSVAPSVGSEDDVDPVADAAGYTV